MGHLEHTIENQADEISGKTGLLIKVQMVRDLGSIRIVGPWLVLAPHDSDVYEGVLWRRAESKVGRGKFLVEKGPGGFTLSSGKIN